MSFFGHSGTGAVFGERYWRVKLVKTQLLIFNDFTCKWRVPLTSKRTSLQLQHVTTTQGPLLLSSLYLPK